MQPIGAFKLRGATNAVLNAPEGTKAVTCCSTGNHGRAVAHAARQQGLSATICMSSLVPQNKIDQIRALGADVRIVGTSQDEAMAECRRLGETQGFVDISPFDDRLVIAGQGTVGLEMLQERPDLDMLLVPVSGGGLAGGVALAAKAINPGIRVIGVSMDRGAAMYMSFMAGHPVEVTEVASLADSLGGGIGLENKLSFNLCRSLLEGIVLVTEDEIYRALQTLYFEDSHVAEGASVVGIAALLADKLPPPRGPVATIVTGRNVDMDQFTDVISGRPVKLDETIVQGRSYDA